MPCFRIDCSTTFPADDFFGNCSTAYNYGNIPSEAPDNRIDFEEGDLDILD